MLGPEEAVEGTLRQARKLIESGHTKELLQMLKEADADLAKRLVAASKKSKGQPLDDFTSQRAQFYREQIAITVEYAKKRLAGLTEQKTREALKAGVEGTVRIASAFESKFSGGAQSLRLNSASMVTQVEDRLRGTMLRRSQTSVDRYGQFMVSDFERVMRSGITQGLSQYEMIKRLVRSAPPEVAHALRQREPRSFPDPDAGFMQRSYWAERIVRTETANAYNASNLESVEQMRVHIPDMGKKILAHFDSRTALDSMYVHGQIRKVDELFRDGAGREYLRPPARPNDRETVIPWRTSWPETAATKPRSLQEIASMEAARDSAKGLPPRPRSVMVGDIQKRVARTQQFVEMAPPSKKDDPKLVETNRVVSSFGGREFTTDEFLRAYKEQVGPASPNTLKQKLGWMKAVGTIESTGPGRFREVGGIAIPKPTPPVPPVKPPPPVKPVLPPKPKPPVVPVVKPVVPPKPTPVVDKKLRDTFDIASSFSGQFTTKEFLDAYAAKHGAASANTLKQKLTWMKQAGLIEQVGTGTFRVKGGEVPPVPVVKPPDPPKPAKPMKAPKKTTGGTKPVVPVPVVKPVEPKPSKAPKAPFVVGSVTKVAKGVSADLLAKDYQDHYFDLKKSGVEHAEAAPRAYARALRDRAKQRNPSDFIVRLSNEGGFKSELFSGPSGPMHTLRREATAFLDSLPAFRADDTYETLLKRYKSDPVVTRKIEALMTLDGHLSHRKRVDIAVDPAKVRTDAGIAEDRFRRKSVDMAFNFMSEMVDGRARNDAYLRSYSWSNDVNPDPKAKGAKFDRAFCDWAARDLRIETSHAWNPHTMTHELMHAQEHSLGSGPSSYAFIKRRAEGKKQPEKLSAITGVSSYTKDEVAFRDKWLSPYVGKVYSHAPNSTEVASMGAENMHRSPLDFAAKDPEHFELMVGMMNHAPMTAVPRERALAGHSSFTRNVSIPGIDWGTGFLSREDSEAISWSLGPTGLLERAPSISLSALHREELLAQEKEPEENYVFTEDSK